MTQIHDLTERQFGRLIAYEIVGKSKDRKMVWRCLCVCGRSAVVASNKLVSGHTQSCGCIVSARMRAKYLVHGHACRDSTGNKRSSRTHTSWVNMKARCRNPKNQNYKYYGGRGITITSRWDRFENFLADMGERPEGKTLDRIDTEGNYHKENCKWATHSEQTRNRRKRMAGASRSTTHCDSE